MVDVRRLAELAGGVALGKVVKYIGRFIPFEYSIAGLSAKNLALGAAMIVGAEYGLRYGLFRDMLELGGVSIIVDEIAKLAGVGATAPAVVRAVPKVSAPAPAPAPRKSMIIA